MSAHPCAVLNVVNVELHGNVKAVQKVSPKHQSVHWSVNGMDPPYTHGQSGLVLENLGDSYLKHLMHDKHVYLKGS